MDKRYPKPKDWRHGMSEAYVESRYRKFTDDNGDIAVKRMGPSNHRMSNGCTYSAWWEGKDLYTEDDNGQRYNIQHLNGTNGASWKPVAIKGREQVPDGMGGFTNAFTNQKEYIKPTEEEKMAQVSHVTFEKTTLIDDEPVSMYSDGTLLSMIQTQTQAAKDLMGTGVKGKYIDREVAQYVASAERLNALLDERVKEE